MAHFRKNIITLMMGERCNLACRYCYLNKTRKQNPRQLDADFAKAGIKDFFEDNIPAIRFFGSGEPTMEFDLIKELWEYANSLIDRKIFSELQTNGYFTSNITEWVSDHISMVWISCDGPPFIQNYSRPTVGGGMSGTMVQTTIRKIAQKTTVGVRSTIGTHNVGDQKRMIDYFNALGVRYVFADHMCQEVGGTSSPSGIDGISSAAFVEAFLEAKEYASQYGMFYSNFLTVNFDEECDIACRAMVPRPHLTPSGYVSACDMVDSPTFTELDTMLYGVWVPALQAISYNHGKIEKIQSRRVGNLPDCEGCEVERFCAGGCAGEAINETGDMYGVKKDLCEATRLLAKHLGTNYQNPYPILHP